MLWSKGVDRSLTGELRMEENISGLIAFIITFLYKFFGVENAIHVTPQDGILYIQLGIYTGRAKIVEKSPIGMMTTLLNCMDNLLIKTRDVEKFFFLRDKIQRNIDFYNRTHDLKDLYFV